MKDFEKWLEKQHQTYDLYPTDVIKAGFQVFSKQELAELLAEKDFDLRNKFLDVLNSLALLPPTEVQRILKINIEVLDKTIKKQEALRFLKERGEKIGK